MAAKRLFKARIVVDPRPEILDPQGKAIQGALERIGFPQVKGVRAGKSLRLELEAKSAEAAREALAQMSERLLANPVIEVYSIEELEETAS